MSRFIFTSQRVKQSEWITEQNPATVYIPTWCLFRYLAEVTHKSLNTKISRMKSVKCAYHRCRRLVWKLTLHSSNLAVLNKKEVYYPRCSLRQANIESKPMCNSHKWNMWKLCEDYRPSNSYKYKKKSLKHTAEFLYFAKSRCWEFVVLAIFLVTCLPRLFHTHIFPQIYFWLLLYGTFFRPHTYTHTRAVYTSKCISYSSYSCSLTTTQSPHRPRPAKIPDKSL